jgi:hypothetical protein
MARHIDVDCFEVCFLRLLSALLAQLLIPPSSTRIGVGFAVSLRLGPRTVFQVITEVSTNTANHLVMNMVRKRIVCICMICTLATTALPSLSIIMTPEGRPETTRLIAAFGSYARKSFHDKLSYTIVPPLLGADASRSLTLLHVSRSRSFGNNTDSYNNPAGE